MQGGQQTTSGTLNPPGTTHQWHAAAETDAPPGDESYRQTSGRAVTSFVLALVALPLSWIPFASIAALGLAVAALSMGIKAFKECNRSRELEGSKLAISGIALGALGLVISLGFVVFWGIMLAVEGW